VVPELGPLELEAARLCDLGCHRWAAGASGAPARRPRARDPAAAAQQRGAWWIASCWPSLWRATGRYWAWSRAPSGRPPAPRWAWWSYFRGERPTEMALASFALVGSAVAVSRDAPRPRRRRGGASPRAPDPPAARGRRVPGRCIAELHTVRH